MNLKSTLRGTGTAIITPFLKDESVDYKSLDKLINWMLSEGVNYLVALGTTGETPTLNNDEKQEIIRFTSATINGRVPLVVGVGGNNTRQVQEDIASLNFYDAVAILSASPYYNKPSQEGIYQHYKAIAGSSKLPIILYNVPGRTGRNMEAATTLRLAAEVENIAGIKEAANNLEQCKALVEGAPEHFLIVSGDDDLVVQQLPMGMDGVISVAANCFPAKFCKMVQMGLAGDMEGMKTINNGLKDAYRLLFEENNPAGAKAFLYEMKMIENIMRLPVTPLSAPLHEQVEKYLANAGTLHETTKV